MAQNKAAEELAALTEAANRPVEQAQRIAARDQAAGMARGQPQAYDRDGDGEADYAVPEGLATAVVGSFIMGPVGGALVGLAQAWMGKQERQNILDQNAAVNDTMQTISSEFNGQIEDLKTRTDNQDDLDQLSAHQAQLNAGMKMATSGNPEMAAKGMEMVQTAWGEVQSYTLVQETQRIEQNAIEEQTKRELGVRKGNQAIDLWNKHDVDAQPFVELNSKLNNLDDALAGGTPMQQMQAAIGVYKIWDPESVVKPEEAAALGLATGWYDRGVNYIERMKSGDTLSPDQRKELANISKLMRSENNRQIRAVDAKYMQRADILGLDDKYKEPFSASANLVEPLPRNWQNMGPRVAEQAVEKASEAAGGAGQGGNTFMQGIERGLLDFLLPDDITSGRPQRRTN